MLFSAVPSFFACCAKKCAFSGSALKLQKIANNAFSLAFANLTPDSQQLTKTMGLKFIIILATFSLVVIFGNVSGSRRSSKLRSQFKDLEQSSNDTNANAGAKSRRRGKRTTYLKCNILELFKS